MGHMGHIQKTATISPTDTSGIYKESEDNKTKITCGGQTTHPERYDGPIQVMWRSLIGNLRPTQGFIN